MQCFCPGSVSARDLSLLAICRHIVVMMVDVVMSASRLMNIEYSQWQAALLSHPACHRSDSEQNQSALGQKLYSSTRTINTLNQLLIKGLAVVVVMFAIPFKIPVYASSKYRFSCLNIFATAIWNASNGDHVRSIWKGEYVEVARRPLDSNDVL